MIKPFYLIFIFLCALSLTETVKAGDADSLFTLSQFRAASLEYERIIAYSSDQVEINEARYKKSLCYKQLHKFDKAQVELLKISYWNTSESLATKYRYETALCSYLSGNFTEALFQMSLLEQQSGNSIAPSTKTSVLLLKALSYNELMQWDKAYETACAYIDNVCKNPMADSIKQVLAKQFSKRNLPKIRSEKKANVLKMIPGLGQAYAGNILEGTANFTLNLAFLSFGVYQIYYGFYITGYFVGAIGLNKVYFGGHARTTYLIHRNNYKKQRKFCYEVKNILTNKKLY